MNIQHPLTRAANSRLILALQNFGNTLNIDHKKCLFALNDSMTAMAEGSLQGRWAFGLPTGTGKTRAIVEWITAVCEAKLPYSVAVAASRIEALCTLKRDLVANGVPADLIGLLHEGPTAGDKKASLPATKDNDTRPFLLCSHQMIRAKSENLSRYNMYQGQPRNLLIYDESLIASDVRHFGTEPLCANLAHAIEYLRRRDEHAEMSNFLTEIKAIIEAAEDKYDPLDVTMIEQPELDPRLAEQYIQHFSEPGQRNNPVVVEFLKASNLPLRMLKSGSTAIVSYQVVVPEALNNILVLDASFPIRKLCHYDSTIKSAETRPGFKQAGVPAFHSLKKFDNVNLYRLKTYGGRYSMEKRFKDKTMAKEVAQVVKDIPVDESVLFFVFKQNQPGSIDYGKVLLDELAKAGMDIDAEIDGEPRLKVLTWGSETSLNSEAHRQHVFLVGILHRNDTELMGQYLGQIDDLQGEIGKALAGDLQLSERAHLAYQGLSRGACRFVDKGQARSMTGYIVEIDPEIETALSSVMPGVTWKTWTPFYMQESDNLIDTWVGRVRKFLAELKDDRVSSQTLKKSVHAEKVHPSTWKLVVQGAAKLVSPPKKDHTGDCLTFVWKLEGRSLVRQTAERYGFKDESAA